ncbi:MAG: hypothetical protein JWR63_1623 [Conexibacter sp.]|nr:hypothetical protein [Conexibacter sp.]
MLSARKSSAFLAALLGCAALAPAAAHAAWSVSSYTAPSNTSQMAGVACTTASSCVAVGFQSGVASLGLSTKWNGSTFTTLTTASSTSELNGVGCSSATACVAVGANLASGSVPHAESYNGTSWSNMTTVTPGSSTFAELDAVACPSSTSCYAVGFYNTATATVPLIETWNGTSWSQQTATLPSGTTNAKLADVSCTSTSACTAVGYYDATSQPRRTFANRWNGTSWANQTVANQSGHTGSELQGVSCTTATACNAVGYYTDSSSVQHSLAQVWNGTLWTLKTVPDPASGSGPDLYDISCWTTPSAGCAAVGGYTAPAPALNVEPLAASWNGTAWSLATVPKASGMSDTSLAGVSCPTTCMAVGAAVQSAGGGVRPAIDVGP